MSDLALACPASPDAPADSVQAEERAWVERARKGDVQAFDAIMMRYEGRLLRFLTGLVSDVEVARELCQDTFLAAYGALPKSHGEMRLSAWLHTIALNRARSHHRARKHRIVVSLGDHDVPADGPDLQDSTAEGDAVRRVLDRLPAPYAEPLLLQITGGLSCREIAAIVGSSEGAVKVRLMRARDAFRRAYEEEVGER